MPHLDSTSGVPNPLEQLSLDQLRTRRSAKWRAFGDDVLPLWIAEMDVPLADPIAEVLHDVVSSGDTGYPAGRAFAQALAGFAQRRWNWEPDVRRTAMVADVMSGTTEALKLVTEPGDILVVSSPVYPPFFQHAPAAGRRVQQAPLTEGGRLDLKALEEGFIEARGTASNVAFLLSNPHNPTGAVHTRAELEQLAVIAERHHVRVIADEVHAPLVLDGGARADAAIFTPYLSVDPYGFSVMSASKGWNLPGLKAALLIAGEDAAADLRHLPAAVAHTPSHLGVLAQTAAYASGEPWLDALLAGLRANRDLLGQLLAEHCPQVRWVPPEGTYLAWLDFREVGSVDLAADVARPGQESPISGPAKFLLEHADVALTGGYAFGDGGAGHARLNMATSQAILTEAVERMGRALRG